MKTLPRLLAAAFSCACLSLPARLSAAPPADKMCDFRVMPLTEDEVSGLASMGFNESGGRWTKTSYVAGGSVGLETDLASVCKARKELARAKAEEEAQALRDDLMNRRVAPGDLPQVPGRLHKALASPISEESKRELQAAYDAFLGVYMQEQIPALRDGPPDATTLALLKARYPDPQKLKAYLVQSEAEYKARWDRKVNIQSAKDIESAKIDSSAFSGRQQDVASACPQLCEKQKQYCGITYFHGNCQLIKHEITNSNCSCR
ncbi:MAG: hypothetical protein HY924_02690 [Elusimicrobia bacterium]|nr:hypothetical protein [Elusimicrobiota bacterium]